MCKAAMYCQELSVFLVVSLTQIMIKLFQTLYLHFQVFGHASLANIIIKHHKKYRSNIIMTSPKMFKPGFHTLVKSQTIGDFAVS